MDTDTDTDTFLALHGRDLAASARRLFLGGGSADCRVCGATGLAVVHGRLRAHRDPRVPFARAGACPASGRRVDDIPATSNPTDADRSDHAR